MEIIINTSDSQPLFAQLIDQIKNGVETGQIKPGDPLPSIRQLATDLELNPNTVAKAYRLLERDAIIETRGYRGTFIHRDARTNCNVDLNAWVISRLSELIANFRNSGVTDSEIRIAFREVMKSPSQ